MKSAIKSALLLLTVCALLGGCSERADRTMEGENAAGKGQSAEVLVGNIPCEFPLVSDGVTLTIMVTGNGDIDSEDVYVWKEYEKMTGVDVNWINVKKGDRSEAIYKALANRQNLDLIMRCRVSTSDLNRYGESGMILDLAKDGLLEKYAPNCWAYLKSHPDALASVMTPDGAIYALPQVNSGAELRVSRKVYIKKAWLDNLNLDIPKTTDEFYEVLKAFKQFDANMNGDATDEIPFCSHDWASVKDALIGAFGLVNRGVHNQLVDFDPQSGSVRLIAASNGYRDYLEYLHRLYSEGLLDNNVFTKTKGQWENNAINDQIGVFAHTNLAGLPAEQATGWVAVEEALEGPNGDKLWAPIRANFHSVGAALIPSTCEDVELVLRWLDYFWTDEGTLFYHMGIENETFVAKDDGTYDYMPYIYEEMVSGNLSFDDVVAKYSPYPGGGNPTVEIAPYFMGGEMGEIPARAARALFKYGPEEYWPSFTFTRAESDALSGIQADLSKYISNMEIEFITGARPLSEWDEYKVQLERLRMAEMLDIYQAAVDRYHALMG